MIGEAKGIYYGWVIVAICMVALMLAVGTTQTALNFYILPVSQDYGLSRATMNSGAILMSVGAALAALFVGRLADRYSLKLIMTLSCYLLAASLVALGLTHNLWLSAFILFLPIGVAISGIGTITSPTLIARWFTAQRARALAIAVMGMSFATILISPPLAWLIVELGWRTSLIALGILVAVVMTVLLPFVRNGPRPDEQEPGTAARPVQGAAAGDPEAPLLSQRQLVVMPRFWLIGIGLGFAMVPAQAIIISLIPIALEAGISPARAAALISVTGIAGMAGKVLVAWLADRFDRALLMAGLCVMLALASSMMLLDYSYPLLVASCIVVGTASGAAMPVYLALIADQFGARSFGTANGTIALVRVVLSSAAVRFAGEVYDRTGSYDVMFGTFIGTALLAMLIMFGIYNSGRRPALAKAG